MKNVGAWRILVLLLATLGLYTGSYVSMIGGAGHCAPRGPYYHVPKLGTLPRRTLAYKVARSLFAPAYWVDSRIRPAWFGEDPERGFFE